MTMESQSPEPLVVDRRRLLKKAAVGGAVVWTAPVVLSSPAFAQCFSQTGAPLSWNATDSVSPFTAGVVRYVRGNGNSADSIQFQIRIDTACSCAPLALANNGYSVAILEQPATPTATLSPLSSTTLNQTFTLQAGNNQNNLPQNATYVIGFTVQFTCNGVRYCSRRAFRFTTPATRPTGNTTLPVTYPKKYVQPGDPLAIMWNSQQGFATTCCAGGIVSGPTCF